MAESPYLGPILSEEHWETSGNPERMVEFLGEGGSARRWRLFACACCWRILPLLEDERSRAAVSLAERHAEGLVPIREVTSARHDAEAAVVEAWQPGGSTALRYAALAASDTLSAPRRAFVLAARATGGGEAAERDAQCRLLRELFGNPFQPFAIEPVWRTPEVLAIAGHVYDSEQFTHLPVLADALEDAGCAERALLDHCREEGAHLRGCWALDALLGKS